VLKWLYPIAVWTGTLLFVPLTQAEEETKSYTFEGLYRLDYWTGLSGPLKDRIDNVGLLDLRFRVEGEKAKRLNVDLIYVQAQGTHGNLPNQLQEAAQGIDNAEVEVNTARIFQAWAEKSFVNGKLSLLFGLYDLNSEFYVTDSSVTLLHPAFGIGSELAQTGRNGPSIFPVTSLTLRATWKLDEEFSWRTALLDGVPGDPGQPGGTHIKLDAGDGTLLISELSYARQTDKNETNKIAIGAWRYSSKFDDLLDVDLNGEPTKSENWGVYILGERTLWHDNDEAARKLDVFLRTGWASADVNQMDQSLGVGILINGPLKSRLQDKLTVGIAAERNGGKWRASRVTLGKDDVSAELAYEVSYRATIKEWFAIQTDFQLVRNPGSQASNNDSLLAGVRLDFSF